MEIETFVVDQPFRLALTFFFKLFLIVLLSSFMAATAYSFRRFRIKKKESEYRKLVRVLAITEDEAEFSTRAISEEYASRDYGLPVAFVTVICVCGFAATLFGADMVSLNVGKSNMVLTAMYSGSEMELQELRWQSQLVLAMAFIGAFVWSAQNVIRRLITGDLTPSTYYGAGLRMIFAALLALMLSFFLEAFPTAEYTREAMPVVAFLTGMMPENALIYLRERVRMFSQSSTRSCHELPLQMIEGVSAFHRARLGEVGIDNAQNLAEANVIELFLKTPFNPSQLIDWVAQAKLYVYFKDAIETLRAAGIRTIFDFKSACADSDRLDRVAELTGIAALSLELVCGRLAGDQGLARLERFHDSLSKMDLDGGAVSSAAAG